MRKITLYSKRRGNYDIRFVRIKILNPALLTIVEVPFGFTIEKMAKPGDTVVPADESDNLLIRPL